jgi:ABC-type multidrug transport system ATPase subunit
MQGILVDRKDPDSRKKAVEAINEHANKSESTFLPTSHVLSVSSQVRTT